MTTPAFEAFLARLYTDAAARSRFLLDPEGEARQAGLTPEECLALGGVDRTGLEMAAASLARKRARKSTASWWRRLIRP